LSGSLDLLADVFFDSSVSFKHLLVLVEIQRLEAVASHA
jgi:hypothetical protein